MAVGEGSLVGNLSYLAIGREITYGTYATCTAGLNFISAGMKITKEFKILEEIQTSRTNSNGISLGKTIEGEVEFYFSPKNAASNYLLHNAFGGGAITSATATGETAGGSAFTHTVSINDFLTTYSSLSFNHRKGETTVGKVFEYSGMRVNEFTFTAELDEALKANVSLIGKDASVTSNDVSSAISNLNQDPLSFVDGRFSIETSNSFTTTSFWHVQSFEFKVNNNLISDEAARRVGSDTLQVLRAGMANFELKCSMRFDTTTALDAMINATKLYGQFEFRGSTLTTSAIREGVLLQFNNLRVMDAGDPEIQDGILTSEVSFAVLRDPTSSGYAVRAQVTNATSTYA